MVIDDDAAALAQLQPGIASQLVTRTNTRRKYHQVGVQLAAIGKGEAMAMCITVGDFLSVLACQHVNAQGLDFLA